MAVRDAVTGQQVSEASPVTAECIVSPVGRSAEVANGSDVLIIDIAKEKRRQGHGRRKLAHWSTPNP